MSSGLMRAAEVLQERRARGEKIRRLTPTERAEKNPRSPRLAIAAKCFECEGGDADPCFQWRIGNCQMPDCPLWHLRPYQKQAGRPEPPSLAVETG